MTSNVILLLFASLSLLLPGAFASVLAIDYGTDWTKASLMKPGIPFDVLLNKDSKRKIHSTVGWNRDDRLFGSDAFNIATRFPQDSFPSLKHIIGTQFASNKTWYYNQVSQAILLETDRGTVALERKKEGARWTIEELIGMQLAYVKSLAEDIAKERVSDLVLTVPSYFSNAERQALLDAIEIAGLRPLALINDGTAVAVNYAMTRSFPEKEYHVIFDAGAGSIRATIASFYTPDAPPATTTKVQRSVKTTTKESAQIEILAFGWNQVASGNELTRRVKEKLVRAFEEKHGLPLSSDGRALARIWKEAERVKSILSANADSSTTLESLIDDIDFKTKTSRAELEEACSDLTPFFAQPVTDALANAGLTWDNITSVILTGGHSRTPIVQAAIRAVAGDAKIAQNVNADEAAVLGAAFYGASLSRQFRTKKIKLQDITAHDIQVSYESESKSGSKRTINTLIFPRSSKINVKKTLTLKRKEDFALRLSYKMPESTSEFPRDVLDIEISNVTAALANLTNRGAVDPVVKVTLLLSESGLVSVHDAVAYGQVRDDTLTGKLKNLFGGGGGSSSSESPSSANVDATSSATGSSSSAPAPAETPSASDAKKEANNNVVLVWSINHLSIRPLTSAEKAKSRQRLISLDHAEQAKRDQEEARNLLEGHTYRLRDLIDETRETTQTPFYEFSTESEREAISSLLDTTMAWLAESADSADTQILRAKKAALEALETPIQGRKKEWDIIPDAIMDLRKALDAANHFLLTASNERDQPDVSNATDGEGENAPKWTLEEIAEIEELVSETTSWMSAQLAEVGGKPKNIDAPFRAAELDARGIRIQKAVLRLTNRKVANPSPKKKAPASSSSEARSSTASPSETLETVPQETHTIRDEL